MKLRTLLTIIMAIASGALAVLLYQRIDERNFEIKEIASVEKSVKAKLVLIRQAQKGYMLKNKQFAGDWDSLTTFLEEGVFYLVDKKEHIETLSYGADSVWVTIDTLGQVAVKDSIFPQAKYGNVDVHNLRVLPHNPEKEFEIWAGMKDGVALFEVADTDPINPDRQADGNLMPLKIGSKDRATGKGNWEK